MTTARLLCIVLLAVAGLPSATHAQAQAADCLNGLYGLWRGPGSVSGRAIIMSQQWAPAIGGAYTELTMRHLAPDSTARTSFEARGLYRASGTSITGTWHDVRGITLNVAGRCADATFSSRWTGVERGRTVYARRGDTLVVIDSVSPANGAARAFGRSTLVRDTEHETDRRAALAVTVAALEAITRKDFVALTDLMLDEGVTFSARIRSGEVRYSSSTRLQQRAGTLTGTISERGFNAVAAVSGPLATVWVPYDLYLNGTWSHCGVDAFTLLKVAGRWRIATFVWSVEQPPACLKHPDGPPRN